MAEPGSTIDPKLLEILVCPLTKAPLTLNRATMELISDVIPIMLPDEARPLDDAEKTSRD